MKEDENWTNEPCDGHSEYWLRTPPSPTGQQIVRGSFHGKLPAGWIRSREPIVEPTPPPLPGVKT